VSILGYKELTAARLYGFGWCPSTSGRRDAGTPPNPQFLKLHAVSCGDLSWWWVKWIGDGSLSHDVPFQKKGWWLLVSASFVSVNLESGLMGFPKAALEIGALARAVSLFLVNLYAIASRTTADQTRCPGSETL
jgi:hypothetical protein